MLNHRIDQEVSLQIPHDLMNIHSDTPVFSYLYFLGLYMGIDVSPLAQPVGANSGTPVNPAAFPSVWPFHFGMH